MEDKTKEYRRPHVDGADTARQDGSSASDYGPNHR